MMCMLISEICRLLDWEPSTASKRIRMYYQEAGVEKDGSPYHDRSVVEHLEQADKLFKGGQAKSFRTALQMVLDKYVEALPSDTVKLIDRRLAALEQGQHELSGQLTSIHSHVEQFSMASGIELQGKVEELLTYLKSLTGAPATNQDQSY